MLTRDAWIKLIKDFVYREGDYSRYMNHDLHRKDPMHVKLEVRPHPGIYDEYHSPEAFTGAHCSTRVLDVDAAFAGIRFESEDELQKIVTFIDNAICNMGRMIPKKEDPTLGHERYYRQTTYKNTLLNFIKGKARDLYPLIPLFVAHIKVQEDHVLKEKGDIFSRLFQTNCSDEFEKTMTQLHENIIQALKVSNPNNAATAPNQL